MLHKCQGCGHILKLRLFTSLNHRIWRDLRHHLSIHHQRKVRLFCNLPDAWPPSSFPLFTHYWVATVGFLHWQEVHDWMKRELSIDPSIPSLYSSAIRIFLPLIFTESFFFLWTEAEEMPSSSFTTKRQESGASVSRNCLSRSNISEGRIWSQAASVRIWDLPFAGLRSKQVP